MYKDRKSLFSWYSCAIYLKYFEHRKYKKINKRKKDRLLGKLMQKE